MIENSKKLVDNGQELFRNNQFKEAADLFRQAFEIEEQHFYEGYSELRALALYWFMKASYEANDYSGLISFMESYLRNHHPLTIMQKGLELIICSYFLLESYSKAVSMEEYRMKYDKYTEEDGMTYKSLAMSHLNLGQLEEAAKDFEEMYYNNYFQYGKDDEHTLDALLSLSWVYLKLGDTKRALKNAIDSNCPEGKVIVGLCRKKWGEITEIDVREYTVLLIARFGENLAKTVFRDIER